MTITLLTAQWRRVFEAQRDGRALPFTPVRASVGTPRYWPEARTLPAIRELMPLGKLFDLDGDEFETAYRARLERIGVDRITPRIEAIWAEHGQPLAFLCFEDVLAGEACHRRTFAAWWLEQTGQHVREVHPCAAAEAQTPANWHLSAQEARADGGLSGEMGASLKPNPPKKNTRGSVQKIPANEHFFANRTSGHLRSVSTRESVQKIPANEHFFAHRTSGHLRSAS